MGDWNYRAVCWFASSMENDCYVVCSKIEMIVEMKLPFCVNVFQNPILSMVEFEDYSILLRVISDFVSFAPYGNVVRVGDNVLELILIDWLFYPESAYNCLEL